MIEPTRDIARRAVRRVVEESPELRQHPHLRRRLAHAMVDAGTTAAELIAQDHELTRSLSQRGPAAEAQAAPTAGDRFNPSAARNAASALKGLKDAIDFPNFVTSLITGVFQSITTSNLHQLQAFADLLEAVNMGTSQFANSQITDARAAQWIASRFPAIQVQPSSSADEPPELSIRDGGEMPSAAELQSALDATSSEVRTINESELAETLLPLIRRKLARDRQSMLATMVLMGMQRVVIDDGSIHAGMDLVVDAKSALEMQSASQTDVRVNTEAAGSFGMGMWGASAKMSASVGHVQSNQDWSKEELAARASLRSSIDVKYHTEPFPLNRMASGATQRRLQDRSMVPEAERPKEETPLAHAERKLQATPLPTPPPPRDAPDPGAADQRELRQQRDFGPGGTDGPAAKGPSESGAGGEGTAHEGAVQPEAERIGAVGVRAHRGVAA